VVVMLVLVLVLVPAGDRAAPAAAAGAGVGAGAGAGAGAVECLSYCWRASLSGRIYLMNVSIAGLGIALQTQTAFPF